MLRHNVPQGRISLPVTGQRGKNHYNVVIPEGVPIVRASALSDYRSTINDAQLSGKREGMLVAVVDPLDGIRQVYILLQAQMIVTLGLSFLLLLLLLLMSLQ